VLHPASSDLYDFVYLFAPRTRETMARETRPTSKRTMEARMREYLAADMMEATVAGVPVPERLPLAKPRERRKS
jgi:hypothetical protein